MADTGIKYPTTGDQLWQAPYDDVSFTTPENICADDSAEAYYSGANLDAGEYTAILRGSVFACEVPAGATIDGIKLEIEHRSNLSGYASKDWLVQLSKDGSTRVGSNYAKYTLLPAAAQVWTYGGEADLWGTTWTAAEINASTFAVHVSYAAGEGLNRRAYVVFFRVTFYYTEGGGGGGVARSQVVWI
jgi:hypothetical protein